MPAHSASLARRLASGDAQARDQVRAALLAEGSVPDAARCLNVNERYLRKLLRLYPDLGAGISIRKRGNPQWITKTKG